MQIEAYAAYLIDVEIDGKHLTGFEGSDAIANKTGLERGEVISLTNFSSKNHFMLRAASLEKLQQALKLLNS